MKILQNRIILFLAITFGSIVAMLKGNEARQKMVFKARTRLEEKQLQAEQKKFIRNGGVDLDDIELSSFHKS